MTADGVERAPLGEGAIEIRRLGSGPRIGYLHGVIGNPTVHPFLEMLGEHHEVVAPSLPGFDGSDAVEITHFSDWVFLASHVLDAAGINGATVVASSVGAMLALEVAAIRPEAFERLVLVAPLGLWDSEHPVFDVWAERGKYQSGYLLSDPAKAASFFDPVLPDDVAVAMDAELRRYRTRRSAASLMWPLPDHGLARRIHRVACPVHVVWGEADRLAPPSYARRFAGALPACTGVTMVAGAGHLAEWDEPRRVADAVVEQVRGLART